MSATSDSLGSDEEVAKQLVIELMRKRLRAVEAIAMFHIANHRAKQFEQMLQKCGGELTNDGISQFVSDVLTMNQIRLLYPAAKQFIRVFLEGLPALDNAIECEELSRDLLYNCKILRNCIAQAFGEEGLKF